MNLACAAGFEAAPVEMAFPSLETASRTPTWYKAYTMLPVYTSITMLLDMLRHSFEKKKVHNEGTLIICCYFCSSLSPASISVEEQCIFPL